MHETAGRPGDPAAPAHGGVLHTYDDHRMAMRRGARSGRARRRWWRTSPTTGKTLPDFASCGRTCWAPVRRERHGEAYRQVGHLRPIVSSDRCGTAQPTAAPRLWKTAGRGRRPGPPGRGSRPRTRTRPAHDDAEAGIVRDGRPRPLPVLVGGTERGRPRCGPASSAAARSWSVTGCAGRRPVRRPGRAGPHRAHRAARPCSAAPPTTPTRTSGCRRQRRPARHRHRAGRPAAPARAHRPLPRRRVRRGLEPLLCLTKSDLAAPDELLALYAARRRRPS